MVFASMTSLLGMIPLLAIGMNYYRYQYADPENKVLEPQYVKRQYDFIVVGGGSAGAVIANRLSEVRNWSVLLLEAGGDETEISDVPALAGYIQLTDLDWKYQTIPAPGKYCQAMKGDRCNWPRGKVLGGSSVLNAMVYVRGSKNDYNKWAELGNPGWDYPNMLKYFLKSEDVRNPYLASTNYHETGGYLTVQESPWRTPLSIAFLQAGMEMGYENRDINGAKQTGFMLTQSTIRRGSRCSTGKAFIRPVRLRKNLDVLLHAEATRVLIDPKTKRAMGVEYIKNGRTQVVQARNEVVLSAGALNSPKLLMLSGIGLADHLGEHNIPVISDLPVGNNMQDHVGLGGLTFVIDAPLTVTRSRFQTIPVAMEYIMRERGPMSFSGVEGVAFVNTKYQDPAEDWPDIQFHFLPSSIASDAGEQIRKILNLRDGFYNTVYKPLQQSETWSILPLLLRPKSTGFVRLNSRNPTQPPKIIPNYFAHQIDVDVLVEGIKMAINVSNSQAFQRFGSRLHNIPLPGCRHHQFESDEYWACCIKQFTFTIYHPSGTCRMGPASDPMAVVDPRLRVYGVTGLRVADASIMPTIVNGNPNAGVIAIGEKASDLIKEDWGMRRAPPPAAAG
ncbi:hypothetical protein KR215_002837 [Drosophila sulfurigaster]|uniref:Glucose dehydrogenase [FAD, quinone] n=1 Tax=Drosophila albomicans TaxID=7291 RepID=A0A6P8XQY9_DROAB|nr:glucose dehydrogenase [FAD, quinone] [Drosophila albomicans]XP_060664078.1 glucose dehydrogenase [FAD, quinone] [Drosophila nasuta]XP_062139048.1 glucose dehydrogenase [FAD, quinone] [Drosophila sulfurigaster albostrigata]KAH8411365.1 hypothetical protein KR215_002837 [Drosophila sulfurigaster]